MEEGALSGPANVRAEVVAFLRRELVGPDPRPEFLPFNGGDEVLRPQDPPRLRYSAGVLFPGGATVEQQENARPDEVAEAGSGPAEGDEPEEVIADKATGEVEDGNEHEVNRANEFLPSAMGLSALIRLPRKLKVTIEAARYEKRIKDNVGRPDRDGQWQPHHYRIAIRPPPLEVDCADFSSRKPVIRYLSVPLDGTTQKLVLHVFCRPYAHAEDPDRDRIITFTLLNETSLSGSSPKDSECFFQCGFMVEGATEGACILEYPDREGSGDDREAASLRLLYRHRQTFAVGHGCAADWELRPGGGARFIRTETLPTHEIKPILPREIPGLALAMNALSAQDGAGPVDICRRLATEYDHWITAQAHIVAASDFPEEHRPAALGHLELCRQCLGRIRDGIDLLDADRDTRRAFAWMNEAMLSQQLHYDLSTKGRRTWSRTAGRLTLEQPFVRPNPANPPPRKGLWRPFQLAFILMNLRSIAARDCPERAVVDLIWFPTGGGKTEAYLGLTAFSIFRRRLADRNDAGTTILMRYTLRLLTTQQFQRAASLICACEVIRRLNEAALGPVRISVGLWVGGTVTPNRNSDAITDLGNVLKNGGPNKFIVLTCPWCGAEMGPVKVGNGHYQAKGYRKEADKVVFRCEDATCDFRDARGLPMVVVDQAIYEERPTLVIGTVDKFAMLPWLPEARTLFGLHDLSPVSPPELVIQDELHLISGALGSMVGMYEGTIDALCRHNAGGRSFPAKIVASTATICRAGEQVNNLYARDVFLFPPQGLQAGDSFFAEETLTAKDGSPLPGRLYVGVFGTALSSHVTAQIRVMAALLQSVKCLQVDAPAALDPYWTLMAYFNSLRELGHAATLIRADIREYLNAVWDRLNIRKPAADSGKPDLRRFINRDLELTSRIQSSEITEVLQQLFNRYPGTEEHRPVDVCLATNMIQVGLDVPRLGLMTVVGQPKTTAEYIQATSRVGRDESGPGLVVTVYNPGKPRDRSHFEHFHSYHQSIYRWVEPTSVTPFAIPVRERALHAQLVTLLRYWGDPELRKHPKPAPNEALVERVREVILSRIRDVDGDEVAMAETQLTELIRKWRSFLPSKYGKHGPPPEETPLMYPSGTEPRMLWATRAKATPSSMRNVDAGCDAKVIPHFPPPGS
jgi:hypothetical protein